MHSLSRVAAMVISSWQQCRIAGTTVCHRKTSEEWHRVSHIQHEQYWAIHTGCWALWDRADCGRKIVVGEYNCSSAKNYLILIYMLLWLELLFFLGRGRDPPCVFWCHNYHWPCGRKIVLREFICPSRGRTIIFSWHYFPSMWTENIIYGQTRSC